MLQNEITVMLSECTTENETPSLAKQEADEIITVQKILRICAQRISSDDCLLSTGIFFLSNVSYAKRSPPQTGVKWEPRLPPITSKQHVAQ
ncbi:hypothetical protein GE061_006045 [Apolygus lucorum]|uniref:Uncharacterized protein n=1 Tax=Apolygus lucorum TaxID=248454 RepID=A0A8S9WSV1_APOLU|nr:hypothetical protein GE061_006045 [Apolygus lucorum]